MALEILSQTLNQITECFEEAETENLTICDVSYFQDKNNTDETLRARRLVFNSFYTVQEKILNEYTVMQTKYLNDFCDNSDLYCNDKFENVSNSLKDWRASLVNYSNYVIEEIANNGVILPLNNPKSCESLSLELDPFANKLKELVQYTMQETSNLLAQNFSFLCTQNLNEWTFLNSEYEFNVTPSWVPFNTELYSLLRLILEDLEFYTYDLCSPPGSWFVAKEPHRTPDRQGCFLQAAIGIRENIVFGFDLFARNLAAIIDASPDSAAELECLTNVIGIEYSAISTALKNRLLPKPLPGGNAILAVINGELAWFPVDGGGTIVLGAQGGQLAWLQTDECPPLSN
jgi:hypothetical protein